MTHLSIRMNCTAANLVIDQRVLRLLLERVGGRPERLLIGFPLMAVETKDVKPAAEHTLGLYVAHDDHGNVLHNHLFHY